MNEYQMVIDLLQWFCIGVLCVRVYTERRV